MTYAIVLAFVALCALAAAYGKGWIYWPETAKWNPGPPQNKGQYTSQGVEFEQSGDLFELTVPRAPGHINYFSKGRGPIKGPGIYAKLLVECDEGIEFVAPRDGTVGTISLYLSSARPDFSGKEDFGRWWWEGQATVLRPGVIEFTAPLDGFWQANTTDSIKSPKQFAAMLARKGRIGFTFSGTQTRGHMLHATGHATIKLLELSA